MALLDVKAIQKEAKKEILEERTDAAKSKLKELYSKKEKAVLVVRNIDREIDNYLNDIAENATFLSAGVDVTK